MVRAQIKKDGGKEKDVARAQPRIDGRTARAQRTRAAILDALLDLIDEGNLQPTASEVATRADVALRSIRQHFESREALFLAASERHAERMRAEHSTEMATEGATEDRVKSFVEARSRVLEATSPIRRAASLRESSSAALSSALRAPARERRREIERVFATELAACDVRSRPHVLDAMDLVASGKAWDALRRDMARSRVDAERIVATALLALTRLS